MSKIIWKICSSRRQQKNESETPQPSTLNLLMLINGHFGTQKCPKIWPNKPIWFFQSRRGFFRPKNNFEWLYWLSYGMGRCVKVHFAKFTLDPIMAPPYLYLFAYISSPGERILVHLFYYTLGFSWFILKPHSI